MLRFPFSRPLSAVLMVLACVSPAPASAADPSDGGSSSSDHMWELVGASLGFVGAGAGAALAFTSFKTNSVDAPELAIGGGLMVAGVVTMVLILNGDHHHGAQGMSLAPVIHWTGRMEDGQSFRLSRLSSDSPGLTITAQF